MPFCENLENNISYTSNLLISEFDLCQDILGSDLDTTNLNFLLGSNTISMDFHSQDPLYQSRCIDECPPYPNNHQSLPGTYPVNSMLKKEPGDGQEQDLAEEILNEVQQTAMCLDLPLDPALWNSQQVLRWISCMQQRHQLPEINPSQFTDCSGSQFTKLSKQELIERTAAGDVLFAQLTVWKNALQYKLSKDYSSCLSYSNSQAAAVNCYDPSQSDTSLWCYRKRDDSFSSSNSYSSIEESPPPPQSMLELMQQDDMSYLPQTSPAPCPPTVHHPFPSSSPLLQTYPSEPSSLPAQPMATYTPMEQQRYTASAPTSQGMRAVPPIGRHPIRGRHEYKERDPMSSDFDRPIHLWEFLLDLLETPDVYSSCIRWLDRKSGVFKIEDSVQVAKLWGRRKNRPAMNYDKLSRSVRQYYKKGIIVKTGDSKRLIYKFGPRYCPK